MVERILSNRLFVAVVAGLWLLAELVPRLYQ